MSPFKIVKRKVMLKMLQAVFVKLDMLVGVLDDVRSHLPTDKHKKIDNLFRSLDEFSDILENTGIFSLQQLDVTKVVVAGLRVNNVLYDGMVKFECDGKYNLDDIHRGLMKLFDTEKTIPVMLRVWVDGEVQLVGRVYD